MLGSASRTSNSEISGDEVSRAGDWMAIEGDVSNRGSGPCRGGGAGNGTARGGAGAGAERVTGRGGACTGRAGFGGRGGGRDVSAAGRASRADDGSGACCA